MCSLGLARSSSLLCSWTSSASSTSSIHHTEDTRDTFFRSGSSNRTNTVVTAVEGRSGRRSTSVRVVRRCPSVGAKYASRAARESAPLLQGRRSAPSSRRNSFVGSSDNNNDVHINSCTSSLTASTSCLASETKSSSAAEFSSVVTTQLYSAHISPYGRPAGRKRWKRVPEITSAKQRASVMWIVQKANKNKVPAEYQDPYYRDHEGREHLKPGIVAQLANADLYCSALANIYGDPNYFSLSHWKVIQALARKGVYVAEPTDVSLNETVLLQNSPIKMSAHLAVIEAMMALYIREVVVADRVVSALQKISGPNSTHATPQDQEEALVLWVAKVTMALQDRIATQVTDDGQQLPEFPRIQDLSDLSDGIGLAALVSYYCPQELAWGDIAVADPPSMADSLYNIGLVIKFCNDALPYNPCLLTKEDIVYMHSCVKQNVLAFVTELFFLLELQPVSCVVANTRKASGKYASPSGASSARSTVSSAASSYSGHSSTGHSYHPSHRRSGSYTSNRVERRGSMSNNNTGGSTGDVSYAIAPSAFCSPVPAAVPIRAHIDLRRQHSVPIHSEDSVAMEVCRGGGLKRQHSLTTEPSAPEGNTSRRDSRIAVHDGMKPAGAPSVRRSSSMTLNDMATEGGGGGTGRARVPEPRQHDPIGSSHSDYGGRESSMSDGPDSEFVVQRARGVSTLNDMIRNNRDRTGDAGADDQQHHASSRHTAPGGADHEAHDAGSWYDGKQRRIEDDNRSRISQEDEDAIRLYRRDSQYGSIQDLQQTEKMQPAGMPSRYDHRPQGRSRSRRNSISADESQLTVENFGGSQDNLNLYISRNSDKEPVHHVGRKDSAEKQSRASQIQVDNRVLDKLEREAIEREKREFMFSSKNAIFAEDPPSYEPPPPPPQQQDSDSESDRSSSDKDKQLSKATSFAELSKSKEQLPSGGINVIYMQEDKDDKKPNKVNDKKTSFAALPNQTTWKQQSVQNQSDDNKGVGDENMEPQIMASELHNVRLKLEEKRRRIETEKRKMELMLNKQRQKMGKEAFMQAVVKGSRGGSSSTGTSTPTTTNTSETDLHQIASSNTSETDLQNILQDSLMTEASPRKFYKDSQQSSKALEHQQQQPSPRNNLTVAAADNRTRDYSSSSPGGTTVCPAVVSSGVGRGRNVQQRYDNRSVNSGGGDAVADCQSHEQVHHHHGRAPRPQMLLQDIGDDVSQMSRRWLEGGESAGPGELRTPDMDAMDYDQYQNSLTQMTDSLSEIQGDIQRLSSQQQQIQGLMHNGQQQQQQQQQQFYLHDQSPGGGGVVGGRRMWGDGGGGGGGGGGGTADQFNSMSPATRRAQWGPVRPVPGDYYQQGGPAGYYPPSGYQQLPPLQQQQGGFMLHQPHSLPAGAQPMFQQQQQNGGGQPYYGTQDQHYRGGYPPPPPPPTGPSHHQFPPGQDGGRGVPAPFRLHSDNEDSRAPSSLRSSAQSSPSRQPLQQYQQQQHYNHYSPQQPYSNHNSPQQYNQQYPHQPYNQQQQINSQQMYNNNLNSQQQGGGPPQSRQSVSPSRGSKPDGGSVIHAPVTAPPPDDMEPQNVSFIDSSQNHNSNERTSQERESTEQQQRTSLSSNRSRSGDNNNSGGGEEESPTTERLKRMSIGSGNRTYRITNDGTSPTRPTVGTKTFRVPTKRGTPVHDDVDLPQPMPHQRSVSPPYQPEKDDATTSNDNDELVDLKTEPLNDGAKPDKGFYISFDDDAPVKPKPPLRTKKFTRKSSTPTTPVSTPSKEEFPVMPDTPLRHSRFPSNTSLDHSSSSTNLRRSFTPTSPTSPSVPYSPSTARTPFSPTHRSSLTSSSPHANGFSFAGEGQDSPMESGEEEIPPAEIAGESSTGLALLIGEDMLHQEESALSDMEKKKQRLMIMSMRRKQQQEELRRSKEVETDEKREKDKDEELRKLRKKEEEKQRRELILEKHKIKKAIELAEKEGRYYKPPAWYLMEIEAQHASKAAAVRMRSKQTIGGSRQRPKTMVEGADAPDGDKLLGAKRNRGSTQNVGPPDSSMRKSTGRWGSSHSLSRAAGSRGSTNSLSGDYASSSRTLDRRTTGRRPTSVVGGGNSQPLLRHQSTKSRGLRKRSASEHDSLVYGMSEDSGLGRATPPRRAASPGMAAGVGARHLPSPSQPGSLPPGLITRRRTTLSAFDDAASDISVTSSTMDFTGPRLYKQPTSKSNRPIVLNAVEFCVFPGAVNQHNKHRVMEEIARSEAKHFLFLFRDAGCQFRGLYSYNLETEEVDKLHGTGPKRVTDNMFDKFFKYNSGAKSFSPVHTKHLTATTDAFTIHNSLWQGKRVSLPSKKDLALVI